MASATLMTRKDGSRYYRIRYTKSKETEYQMIWDIPKGYTSPTKIQAELKRVVVQFEQDCNAGKILTKKQKKELERKQAEEDAKIQTVRQYAERVFMPGITIRSSENTRSSYQTALNKHILPVIGNRKITEVTAADINALLLNYQSDGAAVASVVKVYTIIQGLFKSAYMDDTIDRNIMDKVPRPRSRKDELISEEPEHFTAEETKYIFACLNSEPLKWQCYISLLMDTGMRRGEACGLQWDCVDLEGQTVRVKRTLNYTPGKGTYCDTPKSKQVRTIPIHESVCELLRQLLAEQKELYLLSGRNKDYAPKWVFTQDKTAEPMHPQSPTRYFSKFEERYGVEHFHPHKLRHTYASLGITNGADIASVAENLGHSDKAVTLRLYTHADEESKRKASDIVYKAINGN